MGGNVKFGNHEADKIDLILIERKKITSRIFSLLCLVNEDFSKQGKFEKLWSDLSLLGMDIFSGSSEHLFNVNIKNDRLVAVKRFFGDIDVQCPKWYYKNFDAWLQQFSNNFVDFELIGHKCSNGQIITLWHLRDLSINVQIDFEFVDFENYNPSEFSKFSHSSPWEDMELGIKGVFHKLAIRALCARDLEKRLIKNSKTNVIKDTLCTKYAYSVNNGLRKKLFYLGNGVYYVVDVKDSKYTTNVFDIFREFFPNTTTLAEDLSKFKSFIGICELVKRHWDYEDALKFTNGFQDLVFGKNAQKLSKDESEDILIKKIACRHMSTILCGFYETERYEHSKG